MITLTAGWIFKWLAPTPLPPRLTWQQQPGPGGSQTHTTHLTSARLSCPHEVGQQQVSAVCHVTLGTTLVTLAQSTHVTLARLYFNTLVPWPDKGTIKYGVIQRQHLGRYPVIVH